MTDDVVDAVNVFQPRVIEDALGQGVTAAYLAPRSMTVLAGSGAVIKFVPGSEPVVLRSGETIHADLEVGGPQPSGRLRQLKKLSAELLAARKYIDAWEDYQEKLEEYEKELEKLRKEEGVEEESKDASKDAAGKKPKAEKPEKPEKPKEDPKPPKEEPKPKPEEDPDKGEVSFWSLLEQELGPRTMRLRRDTSKPEGKGGDKEGGKGDKEKEAPKKPSKPRFDARKEVLRKLLEGDRVLHARPSDAADILNLLELQREFQFRMVLTDCPEAHRVVHEIREARVPVVMKQMLSANDEERAVASELAKGGVSFAISMPGKDGASTRYLSLGAASAVAGGLDPESALSAVTSGAAKILDVDGRIGSLEPGKDADLVIASAEPFASDSVVERVFIDGNVVFER